jgi:asparagine synthase (glutamine-hydrolysing)
MAGICGFKSNHPTPLDELWGMQHKIYHRGKNEHGMIYLTSEGNYDIIQLADESSTHIDKSLLKKKSVCGLAQHRNHPDDIRQLATMVYQCDGHQYGAVMDGIIYYSDRLSEAMDTDIDLLESMDPLQIIVTAYEKWGMDMVNIVDGSFSFALLDFNNSQLILYRDKMGSIPLYYWKDASDHFHFSSEIKSFTACKSWKAILNKKRAIDYLVWEKKNHTLETMFENVHQVPPGYFFKFNLSEENKRMSSHSPYWETLKQVLENEKNLIKKSSITDLFKSRFIEGVKHVLNQKGQKGIALSGGLDSSAILVLSEMLSKQNEKYKLNHSFSACSTDPRYSEKIWMDGVLDHTSVSPHFVFPEGSDVFTLTEDLVYQQEEPYFSQRPLLSHFIYKEADNEKTRVVLNGSAADAYFNNAKQLHIHFLVEDLKTFRWRAFLRRLKISNQKLQDITLLVKLSFPTLWSKVVDRVAIRKKWGKRIDFSILGNPGIDSNALPDFSTPLIFIQNFNQRPVQSFIRNAEKSAAMHGVEVYFPFVHQHLMTLMAQVLRTKNLDLIKNKQMIIDSVSDILPEIIKNRKNKGHFTTAEESWFKHEYPDEFIRFFKEYVPFGKGIIKEKTAHDYLQKMQKGDIPFTQAYWRLICFCVWMKVYDVQLDDI